MQSINIKKLRYRIPFVIIVSAMFMIGVSYFVSASLVKQETISRVELELRDRLYFLQNAYELFIQNGDTEKSQSLISSMISEPDLLIFLYVDKDGKIKNANTLSSRGENVFVLHAEIEPEFINASIKSRLIKTRLDNKQNYIVGIAPVCEASLVSTQTKCGFIYFKIDTQYHIANAKKLLYLEAVVISLGMFLIALVLMYYLYFWITKRFNILAEGLSLFASGNRSSRIVMDGEDEFFHISMRVNELFSKLEEDESELKRRQQELDAVFNTVVDGIVIIDAQGVIYDCNPAVTRLLDYEKHEMLGQNVKMLMPPPYAEEHDQYLHNYMTTHVSKIIGKGREVEAQRKGGDVFPIALAVGEMLFDGRSMFVGVIRDVSEQKHLQAALVKANELLFRSNLQLKNTAKTDGLTGLANRRHFDYVLNEEINRAVRHKSYLSLLMCDVDFFKKYNDSYGHQAGDDCLREIAGLLETSFKRSGELPARYGGEEFAVIIPGVEPDVVRRTAEQFCHTVYEHNIAHNTSLVAERVTMSIGMASLVDGSFMDAKRLISQADAALYQAKEQGRNRLVVYQSTGVSGTTLTDE